ncbi:unnamed protein product [Sympodiomycopsis kandeliae]
MKTSSMLLLPIALALFATVTLANVVVDLTNTGRFDASVGKDRPAMVEFYAPWCGHCKKLEPLYKDVAASFKNDPGRVLIGKVNADENKELGRRFGIKGYPTLKWFPFNSLEAEDYTGPRDVASMVKFINEKTGTNAKVKEPEPPKAVQLTASNFDKIVHDSKKDVLVEFYAPWCGHCKNLAPTYERVAEIYENDDDCVVAQMDADEATNKEVAQQYGVQSFPTIKFFPKSLDGSPKTPEEYPGGRTEDNFLNYMNGKCGIHRLSTGVLGDLAGRMPSLDSLASRFYNIDVGNTADRTSIVEEARKFYENAKTSVNATEAKNTAAAYYLKIMDKMLDNPSYVEKESTRLKKILAKHTSGASQLAAKKADDIKKRINVLSAFTKRQLKDRVDDAKIIAENAKGQAQIVADQIRDEL